MMLRGEVFSRRYSRLKATPSQVRRR